MWLNTGQHRLHANLYVDVGGYYDKKWVECANCKNWNNEYRRMVACHVCKDERGKYFQGKYIPKSKKKIKEKKEFQILIFTVRLRKYIDLKSISRAECRQFFENFEVICQVKNPN
jgi:hypothetical protein